MVYKRSGSDADNTALYTDSGSNTIQIQPQPEISEELENEDGVYTFTWDVNKQPADYGTAVYDIELTGTTIDGTVVSLDTKEGITWDSTAKAASYSIQSQSNWNYKALTLTVSRHGAVGDNNKTKSFPSSAEQEFPIKVALSQIGAATINHDTDDQGNSNMDEMLYHILWDGVPTEAEQNDLAGYIITVVGSDGANDEEATATHYFYVVEDPDGDLPQTIQDLIDGAEDGGYIVTDVTENYDTTGDTLEAEVSLEDFRGGETITVSVQAIAKDEEDAEVYRDGPAGVEQSQTLPDRLTAPDISKLSVQYSTEPTDGVLLVSELEKGVTLAYRNSDGTGAQRLRLAVAVYDTLPEDVAAANCDEETGELPEQFVTGTDKKDANDWKQDAEELLLEKSKKEYMSGNDQQASYSLTPGTGKTWSDYAGKWLKVVLQTTSDSAISSNWTDEDAADLSQNYLWIHIPQAKLDDVALEETEEPVKWTLEDGSWSVADDDTETYVSVRTLTFDTVGQAEGYRIQITGQDQSVHWIYLQKQEDADAYSVSYAATDYSFDSSNDTDSVTVNESSTENAYTRYLGTVGAEESILLPYAASGFGMPESTAAAEDEAEAATLYAALSISSDGTSVTLSLPDVISYRSESEDEEKDAGVQYLMTAQVAVQAMVFDEEGRYFNSDVDSWTVDENGKTNIETLEDLPEAPELSAEFAAELLPAEDSQETEYYRFTLAGEEVKSLTAQLLILDSDYNLLDFRYVSIQPESQEDGTLINGGFNISKDEMENGIVMVRFAELENQILSPWTELYILGQDGSLTEAEEDAVMATSLLEDEAAEQWQEELLQTSKPQGEDLTEQETTEAATEAENTVSSTTEQSTTEKATEQTTTQQSTTENITTEATTEASTENKTTETKREDAATTETTTEAQTTEASGTKQDN